MPLLQGKDDFSFKLHPLPPNLSSFSPSTEVFVIRYTSEIFLDYQSYISTLDWYRQRQWQCAYSGKSNLCFEEALYSEKHILQQMEFISGHYFELLCQKVHHSTLNLKQLVDEIYTTFQHAQDNFMTTSSGRKRKSLYPQTPKTPISKDIIKYKIRMVSTKESYIGAPWIVNDEFVKRFGLKTILPTQLQKLKDAQNLKNTHRSSIKYPIEDLLLPPDSSSPLHPPNLHITHPSDYVGELLMIWDFITRFHNSLNLYLIPLPALNNALHSNEPLNLIDDIHLALIKVLFSSSNNQLNNTNTENLTTSFDLSQALSLLSTKNWPSLLSEFYIQYPDCGYTTNITTRVQHSQLSYFEKINILQILCNSLIDSNALRQNIEQRLSKLSDIRHGRFEKLQQERKNQIEKEKENKEQSVKKSHPNEEEIENKNLEILETKKKAKQRRIKIEREYYNQSEQYYVRMQPMGEDRYHNKYFWSESMGGRIYVQNGKEDTWAYYSQIEEIDQLLLFLQSKGIRENKLKNNLKRLYSQIAQCIQQRKIRSSSRSRNPRSRNQLQNYFLEDIPFEEELN